MSVVSRQRGNVLFLILLAVILFAALAYALTRSSIGVGESQTEKLDTEYSKYASILNLATTEFTRLMVNGCTPSDVPSQSQMSPSANPKCNFFGAHGGHFPYASDTVPHVQLNKLAIPGNATDTDDIVAVIVTDNTSYSKSVCDRVNVKNDITYTLDSAATFWSSNWKNLTDADGNNPGAWPTQFTGHAQGCLYDASIGAYIVFGVVQER